MIPRPVANGLIVLVSVMFAINFGAQFVLDGYHPDPSIHSVFMTIVGGAFALQRRAEPEQPT